MFSGLTYDFVIACPICNSMLSQKKKKHFTGKITYFSYFIFKVDIVWEGIYTVILLLRVYLDLSFRVHLFLLLCSWCYMCTRAHSDYKKVPSIYLSAGMWPRQSELGVINSGPRWKPCVNKSVFALSKCPLCTSPSWISGQNIKDSRMWDSSHHLSLSFRNLSTILYYLSMKLCLVYFSETHYSQSSPFYFQITLILQCSPLMLSPNLLLWRVQLWILDLLTEWVLLHDTTTQHTFKYSFQAASEFSLVHL